MTSWHKTGAHPFYIGMYIHIYTHIYVHKYTSQKECLHIFKSIVAGVNRECLVQSVPFDCGVDCACGSECAVCDDLAQCHCCVVL